MIGFRSRKLMIQHLGQRAYPRSAMRAASMAATRSRS